MDRILCEQLGARAGSPDIIDNFIAALLTHLFRSFETDTARNAAEEKRSALIGKVREYVAEHCHEGNLSKMAASLGYESSYLSRTSVWCPEARPQEPETLASGDESGSRVEQ